LSELRRILYVEDDPDIQTVTKMALEAAFLLLRSQTQFGTMAQQNMQLVTAVSAMSHGIEIVDARSPDLPITYVNAAFERLTGYSADEVVGHNCRFLQGPGTDPATMAAIRLAMAQGVDFSGEILNYRKDGTFFWNDLRISPVREADDELSSWVGIITDVTERKEMDRIKSEFISIVSHELRTPLTAIRGSLGLMAGAMAKELPDKANSLLRIACQNSERLAMLINDMLDIDKIASGQMRFDIREEALSSLILQAVESNRPYAEKLGVAIVAAPIDAELTVADLQGDRT